MWKWLEQYFTYTRAERNGVLLLVFATVAVLLAPKVYFFFKPVEKSDNSKYEKEVDAFIEEYNRRTLLASADTSEESLSEIYNPYANVELSKRFRGKEVRKIEYFDFDPNKIGVVEWVKLGFSEKQAESIEKLKSKGFKFYTPEDLKKVYVVNEENYNRLLPYIKIEPNSFPKKEYHKTTYPEKPKEKFTVDINTADSSLFERQRGIGPSLASRIIRYRERLGGFVSVEQIKEVWGMPDSTYQYLNYRFTVNEIPVNKINLNTADFETMRKHPYINYSYAKVIMAYRKEHGSFKTIEDIKKVPVITDSLFQKMKPYVSVE